MEGLTFKRINMEKTVYFRTFEPEDAEAIYKWTNDDELKQLSIGLNRRICREEADEWIRTRMKHNPYQVWWAICSIETGKIIGYAYLSDIHYIKSSANFGGILIGDSDYRDGFAWIETYLFVYEYGFERLHLNRIYGEAIVDHVASQTMRKIMFAQTEGVLRQAEFRNGRYYDVSVGALLSKDYFEHKSKGDYELKAIIKRLKFVKKQVIEGL